MIYCLGIESTAHTFGASIVTEKGSILSDVKEIYAPAAGKGIHPREAAQHHSHVSAKVLAHAFRVAGVKPTEIAAIALSIGPGLGPPLRVGATVARVLSSLLKKPLVPVHHAIGHIEIGALTTGAEDPLVVLVSGGHTAIAAYADRRWRVFGETEDITLGNVLDMFARSVGLHPPSGRSVEDAARKGSALVDLPYTVKGNDVLYSGLLTAAIKKHDEGAKVEDLSFSLQEMAFSMLAEAAERSLAHTGKKDLLLTGGVAANRRLQEMLKIVAEEHKSRFLVVDAKYSGDCGAQIAWTGLLAFKSGETVEIERSHVKPRWRLDEVDISWRGD